MTNHNDDMKKALVEISEMDLSDLYPTDGSFEQALSKEWSNGVTAERIKQHIVDLDINSMYWQYIDAMVMGKGVFCEAVLGNLKEDKPIIKPTRLGLVGCGISTKTICDILLSNPDFVRHDETPRANWMHYTRDTIFPVIPNFSSDVSRFLFDVRVNNHRGPNRRHKARFYTRDWNKGVRVLWWKRTPSAFKDGVYFRPAERYAVGKVEVQKGKWGSEYIHEVM